MWSAIFFAGVTVSNVALLVDAVVLPNVDLRLARLIPTLIGSSCLLYGFVGDAQPLGDYRWAPHDTGHRLTPPRSLKDET